MFDGSVTIYIVLVFKPRNWGALIQTDQEVYRQQILCTYNPNFYSIQYICMSIERERERIVYIPVVPHKAVAEVSKIGNL